MEEIIDSLKELTEAYIDGSNIQKLSYENDIWKIEYKNGLKADEFDDPRSLMTFLEYERFGS